jgi:hypothetical protein
MWRLRSDCLNANTQTLPRSPRPTTRSGLSFRPGIRRSVLTKVLAHSAPATRPLLGGTAPEGVNICAGLGDTQSFNFESVYCAAIAGDCDTSAPTAAFRMEHRRIAIRRRGTAWRNRYGRLERRRLPTLPSHRHRQPSDLLSLWLPNLTRDVVAERCDAVLKIACIIQPESAGTKAGASHGDELRHWPRIDVNWCRRRLYSRQRRQPGRIPEDSRCLLGHVAVPNLKRPYAINQRRA